MHGKGHDQVVSEYWIQQLVSLYKSVQWNKLEVQNLYQHLFSPIKPQQLHNIGLSNSASLLASCLFTSCVCGWLAALPMRSTDTLYQHPVPPHFGR